jgi:Trypsin-like peptidase domain
VRSSKELDGNLGPQGLRPDILQALVARLKWLRKIPANGLPTLSLGDSSKIQVGAYALAIGDPFGIGETATLGIVSATGRGNPDIEDYEDFIQTDAAINSGNSEALQSRTLNGVRDSQNVSNASGDASCPDEQYDGNQQERIGC